MWDFAKRTEEKSRTEIELTEIFDYLREIETRLKKISAEVDGLHMKTRNNHSRILIEVVIRGE